jgi:hypothetical protein
MLRMRFQKVQKLLLRNGFGIAKSLQVIDAHTDEKIALFFCLHTLDQHVAVQLPAHLHGVPENRYVLGMIVERPQDALVDLDDAEGIFHHLRVVGVAGSEIVHGEGESQVMELLDGFLHELRVVDEGGLGDLQVDAGALEESQLSFFLYIL